jgi:hypothetical protein
MSYEESRPEDKLVNELIDTAIASCKQFNTNLTSEMFYDLILATMLHQLQERPGFVVHIISHLITREYERRKANQEKSGITGTSE